MVKIGDRIKFLGGMGDDPCPLPVGTTGTVDFVNKVDFGRNDRFTQIGVKWDNGRGVMLCTPPDRYEVIR